MIAFDTKIVARCIADKLKNPKIHAPIKGEYCVEGLLGDKHVSVTIYETLCHDKIEVSYDANTQKLDISCIRGYVSVNIALKVDESILPEIIFKKPKSKLAKSIFGLLECL